MFGKMIGLIAGALALSSLSGCSFAFVDGPPRDHASRHFFDCTSSYLAPSLDAGLGALLVLGVVGEVSDGPPDSRSIVEGSALVAGALASATYGYIQASHCREAKDALAQRLLEAPYRMPPSPWSDPRAAASPAGSPTPTLAPTTNEQARALAPRDPWLSEGPPPLINRNRGTPPPPMPGPSPFLPLAPAARPAPSPIAPPADTSKPATTPAPAPETLAPVDAGSRP